MKRHPATNSYRHRLDALEERIDPSGTAPVIVWRDIGEAPDDAIARHCAMLGVPPESLRKLVVIGWDDGTE